MGPAAQTFLSGELHALGVNANTVGPEHIVLLADHIRENAVRVMGERKAAELADALVLCDTGSSAKRGSGHKLASDAAAKLLATGKLRQAEKAFLELVEKHSDRESYVGLAQTQAALEDAEAAVNTLREGAAKFARSGDRASAVSLLAAAVIVSPMDLAAHRRLAAALANQGDLPGAVEEYARYVDAALTNGDSRRALLEVAYGRETLGDLKGLVVLVDRISIPGAQAAPQVAPRVEPAPAPVRRSLLAQPANGTPTASPTKLPPKTERAAYAGPQALKAATQGLKVQAKQAEGPKLKVEPPAPKIEPPTLRIEPPAPLADWHAPLPTIETSVPTLKTAPSPEPKPAAKAPLFTKPAPVFTKPEMAARTQTEASTSVVQRGAKTITHAETGDLESPIDVLARIGVVKRARAPRPATDIEPILKSLTPTGSGLDAAAMAASRAALLTSARDSRATDAVLDAARRLLALGKLSSASDVLLDYIGHGFTEREAQRLLIEIDCALGRRDVAREKCNLLSHAYRLDGRTDVAEDVERLAKIL
jgi:tetratricopeptide (TPR) repeat protein